MSLKSDATKSQMTCVAAEREPQELVLKAITKGQHLNKEIAGNGLSLENAAEGTNVPGPTTKIKGQRSLVAKQQDASPAERGRSREVPPRKVDEREEIEALPRPLRLEEHHHQVRKADQHAPFT